MNLINIESVKLSWKNCSLSELCLPRSLSEADLARFEEIVDTRPPIPKGGTLYRAGDPSRALYAIKSGALKSVATSEDGEEQNDIANYLGLAAETVSRLITRLQESGIVEIDRRRVTIRDFPALRAQVGQSTGVKA